MIIITPETIINKKPNRLKSKSIFLAGTIDNGNSEDWQEKVIENLSESDVNIEVFNPRRKHWNSNSSKKEMEFQIEWEQKHLDKSDLIIMVILDNSKSPITLLEMGLYANSKKLIVFCTDKFYRWDNVRLTCKKYNIPLFEDLSSDNITRKIITYL